MTTLSITLGSVVTGATADPTTTVHADTLQSAKPKDLASNSLQSLCITVHGSDLAATGNVFNPMDLSGYMSSLQPNASVSICVIGSNGGENNLQKIHSAFLLAGLKGATESRQADGSRVFTAQKPSHISSTGGAAVKLNLGNDDDMVIDEDGLLADSSNILAPPPAMGEATATDDDCGGREPCDNCTCGRADGVEKPKEVKTSSCGKCGLGDAFRCAACPYLGKPAFKPGEEHLVLDLQDDF